MIFGPTPLGEAEGAILAHTLRLPDRVLKKGTVLDQAAIAALAAAGHEEIIAARLEAADVGENEAAAALAAALAGPHLGPSRPGTGRVNLRAEREGLFVVDRAGIEALNALDEAITLGTLPDETVVAKGEMVATIKIIPFAVPRERLEAAIALARRGPPLLALHPFRPLTAGLILTELPGLKEALFESVTAATAMRLAALGGGLLPPRRTPHATAPIAEALRALISEGADLLLIAGASAVVDRRDVGPQAIVAAGGEIRHFGMPVDPGNLICIGAIGTRPALVLPGCAGSPKPNGIDFVLRRLAAGLEVRDADIARWGVGGLLKDISNRPLPRAQAVPAETASRAGPLSSPAPRGPQIALVVLAAGQSSRMAPYHKLLLPDRRGKPMIARLVDNLLASPARPVIVVVGHRAEEVRAALAGRPVTFVTAPDYAEGLAASLRAGIAAVPEAAAGAIVCLGDMPLITARIIERLIEAYDPDEGRRIVVPVRGGRQGNPILWDRRFFPEILALTGDVGARPLLARHLEEVAEVEIDDDAIFRDFDTVESLAALPERYRPALSAPALPEVERAEVERAEADETASRPSAEAG
jgi:molybdenum cofactor cytidylyltransferase